MNEYIERKIQQDDNIYKNYLRTLRTIKNRNIYKVTFMIFQIPYVKGKVTTTIS